MSEQEQPRPSRRRALHIVGIGAAGAAVSGMVAAPLVGYFMSVFTKRSSLQWVKVTSLDQIDTVVPREFRVTFRGEHASTPFQIVKGVFVIRRGDEILAFSNVCTHMGCSVRWLGWRQQILCPCHGGIYDRWGQLMGGPPSQNLQLYLSRIEGNDLYIANRIIDRGVQT